MRAIEPAVELGVRGFRGRVFWLLEGQGDGCVEELEGSALGVGGLGEDGHGGIGAGEADLVAGEGAQMGEQSLVAVGGQVGSSTSRRSSRAVRLAATLRRKCVPSDGYAIA